MATCSAGPIPQGTEGPSIDAKILTDGSIETYRQSVIDSKSVVGNYILEKRIGQGTYGEVRLAVNKITNQRVAIKTIEKQSIKTERQRKRLQREVRILRLLHHPHIVKVFDVIETTTAVYIVMEYASGGELFDYLVVNKRLKEREARHFFRQVISAVEYCHGHFVIHRDLKPENLLIDDNNNIKIIDFGFTNIYRKDTLLDTFCGSPYYAAPEMILAKKYTGPEVDIWSLGVILYAMVCGSLPFDDTNIKLLHKKITSGYYFTPKYLSKKLSHLISRMIVVDPSQRATLDEIKSHPWVNESYDTETCSYILPRSAIDTSYLDERALNRLVLFGYNVEDIYSELAHPEPNGIKSAYHLIVESFARADEVTRLATHVANSIPLRMDLKDIRPPIAPTSHLNKGIQDPVNQFESKPEMSFPSSNQASMETKKPQRLFSGKSFLRLLSKLANGRQTKVPKLESCEARELTLTSLVSSSPARSPFDYERDLSMSAYVQATSNSIESVNSPTKHSSSIPRTENKKSSFSMRAMSGWFNSLSSVSRDPSSLIMELIRLFQLYRIRFIQQNTHLFLCEAEYKGGLMIFEVDVRCISPLSLYTVHFKRIRGSLLEYKRVCDKLLKNIQL